MAIRSEFLWLAPLDDRITAANLDPALAQPGQKRPVTVTFPLVVDRACLC